MDRLKCIIVDDEEGAHLVMTHYMQQLGFLELVGQFYNAVQTMEFLYQNKVDLILLDINMPGLSGLQMLEAMSNRPLVVLTTAYKEYALEGYRYEVVDYLVKPFDFTNFLSAIDKVQNRLLLKHTEHGGGAGIKDSLMLKVDGVVHRIEFNDIRYIQSFGNYIKVFTRTRMFISQITTQEAEGKLDRARFMRIHKSYIVALSKLAKISGNQAFVEGDIVLPIGNTYRRELIQRIGEQF